jgi:DNA-binding response OmpR family regulator
MPGKTVMLVDDDQDFLTMTSALLRRGGYEVLIATDAVSAISVAVKQRPRAIVLDIGLPGGDGTMVMDRLHAMPQLAGVPVLILSGRDPATYRDVALKAGAAAYMTKPVQPDELLAALRLALDGQEEGRPDAEAPPGTSAEGGSRLVLLVDDDSDLVAALAATLRRQGFEIAVAADAVSAVSVAVKQRPQAVVLESSLPGGDGVTVMKRLHAMPQLAGVPVLFLSGRDPAAHREAALKAGAVAYLTKPVDTEELVAALREALNPA